MTRWALHAWVLPEVRRQVLSEVRRQVGMLLRLCMLPEMWSSMRQVLGLVWRWRPLRLLRLVHLIAPLLKRRLVVRLVAVWLRLNLRILRVLRVLRVLRQLQRGRLVQRKWRLRHHLPFLALGLKQPQQGPEWGVLWSRGWLRRSGRYLAAGYLRTRVLQLPL